MLKEPYAVLYVHLKVPEDELYEYIKARLHDVIKGSPLSRRIGHEHVFFEKLCEALIRKSANNFAIAKGHLDALAGQNSLDEALEALDRLPLHQRQFLRSLISEIDAQPNKQDRQLALSALAIVGESCRDATEGLALTLDELKEAVLALNRHMHTTLSTPRLLRITRGILTVDGGGRQTVRAFHEDANTYLAEECDSVFAEVKLEMDFLCIRTILEGIEHISELPEFPEMLSTFLEEHPFLAYCIRHWGNYVSTTASPIALKEVSKLLAHYQASPRLRQLMYVAINHDEVQHLWSGSDRLHVVAWFGMPNVQLYEMWRRSPDFDMSPADTFTGRTPLHIACLRGHFELAARLVSCGADPATVDNQGRTCLWLMVEQIELDEKNGIRGLQLLLDHGSSVQAFRKAVNVQNRDSGNQTILMLAVKKRLHGVIRLLLELEEAHLDARDALGRTALHFASSLCDATSLDMLTTAAAGPSARVNLNVQDWLQRTPAMILLATLSSENILVEPEAEALPFIEACLGQSTFAIDMQDSMGKTLLHHACVHERYAPVVAMLLQKHASVNARDYNGETPLHVAAAIEHEEVPEVVSMLKQYGAELTCRNHQGLAPHEVASRYRASWAPVLKADESAVPEKAFIVLWDKLTLESDNLVQYFGNISSLRNDEICQKDPLSTSLLHWAVHNADVELMRGLLSDGRI